MPPLGVLGALMVLMAASAAGASEPSKYVCVGAAATDLSGEGDHSASPGFSANETWHLEEAIAKSNGQNWSAGDKVWLLRREGSEGIKTTCSDWSTDTNFERVRGDVILCRGVYEMVVHKASLLFVLTYSRGYVVGKCSTQ